MKRASYSEISAGEAFRRAFPNYPFGEKSKAGACFSLTRDDAQAALDELTPYFQAIERLYTRDDDAARPETNDEVWSFFDPAASTADLIESAGSDAAVSALAVAKVHNIVKSFGLYAHRVVFEDHLLEWLSEYANPPQFKMWGRSEEWLLRGIRFQMELYSSLLPLLDDEILLPMSHNNPSFSATISDNINSIFGSTKNRVAFMEQLVSSIFELHPHDPVVAESRSWVGGIISKGTQGGFLLHNQKDLKVLTAGILDYCISSSLFYPRLTVAWEDPKLARIHRYILDFIRLGATNRTKDRPFVLTEISTNGAIKPELITMADALAMRNSEGVFMDWRDTVEDCILELRENYDSGSDREKALAAIVKERQRHWHAKF